MSTRTDHSTLPMKSSGVPKNVQILVTTLLVVIVILIFLIKTKVKNYSSPVSDSIEFNQAIPGKGFTIGVNNVTFSMPPDAITMAGTISIQPREPNLYTSINEDWTRSMVAEIVVHNANGEVVPHLNLAKPAEVCFKITAKRWEDFTDRPNEYLIQYYAEENTPPDWVSLKMTTHADQHQICGETDHLSIFALATKPETDSLIPLTGPTGTPTPVTIWTILGIDLNSDENERDSSQGGSILIPSTIPIPSAPPTHLTEPPTESPTEVAPTESPTEEPTEALTEPPTDEPTNAPTDAPTEEPTEALTEPPTDQPTDAPTNEPTDVPTDAPTDQPTDPADPPTDEPTEQPQPTDPPIDIPTP